MTAFPHALITGASSGIGAALARELASRGTRLVLLARRTDRLQALCAELESAYPGAGEPRARLEAIDVRDTQAVRRAIRAWDERLGGLDLLVANAGVGRGYHASRLPWEAVEQVLQVNVLGAFASLHAGLECMLPRRRGTLCGISSLASLGGFPRSGAYSASKAALAAFLETLRIDLAGSGVSVVDVQPGFVESEMTQGESAHEITRGRRMVPTALAASWIADALERGQPICTFPAKESVPLRLLRCLPRPLWRGSLRFLTRRLGRD